MRLLEDNTEENLGDLGFSNETLNTKSMTHERKKLLNGTSLKLKASVLQKVLLKGKKRQRL